MRWYFSLLLSPRLPDILRFFAEKFLDNTAKAKRQNKMLNHRIKLSWSCHATSEDIPEQATSLLSLLFPLPNLPRTLKKSRCIAISVHTSKDTAHPAKSVCHLACHICPATSGPSKPGSPGNGLDPSKTGHSISSCTGTLLHGPEGSAKTRLSKTPTCALSWCNLRLLLLQNPYAIVCKLTEKPQTPFKNCQQLQSYPGDWEADFLPKC